MDDETKARTQRVFRDMQGEVGLLPMLNAMAVWLSEDADAIEDERGQSFRPRARHRRIIADAITKAAAAFDAELRQWP